MTTPKVNTSSVEHVQGLNPSDADYLGHDHQQLEQFVGTNLDVEQVSKVSAAYNDVHKAFESFATTLSTAVNKSKGQWEGVAAESALSYFGSLSKWADANSQNAKLASETIYDQGAAAANAKNQMPKPIPFNWNDEFQGWMAANPLDLGDNIDKSLQKQKDSQQAHQQAADVMKTYDKDLYSAASKQPVFPEPPAFAAGGGSAPAALDISSHGHSSSGGSSGSGDARGSGGSSSFLPPHSADGAGSGPMQSGSSTGAGVLPPGNTTPAGLPPGVAPAAANAGGAGMGGMGAMPMGGMGGMGGGMGGGDSEYNSKVGRGGGFGPGEPGLGGSSGSGASSGAARPGGVGAAEAAAGRGMGGGAATRGGAGMAARGRSGEVEEDAEHQRAWYLVGGEPEDDVFGSDQRTAPPVIGE
ncbi:PPE domain-containing protein [Amycolatopsis sp. H20-H5]|uniref:PPE domain-containing protein n=1 Tax=Amycolatopsis sp. H20-H5 TaxID=3046309 RepID=UPI002DBE13F4|nr:hypothetical protein [Amycolatopsis sp. H20-H5]MEC3975689.1 hypothetical protein [Amycolatopsis sp. H20-H5]